MTTYRFSGHIIDRSTHHGIPSARVEAWDAEGRCTDLIAFEVTDAQGAFTMTLGDAYLKELFHDRGPVISFRIFTVPNGGGTLARCPSQSFLWTPVHPITSGRIEVDNSAPRAGGAAPSTVRGVVQTAAGAPRSGLTVRAYDMAVGANAGTPSLGDPVITDAQGHFTITFGPTPFESTDRVHPDLVVRAADQNGTIVAESSVICHAPATVTASLVSGGTLLGPADADAMRSRLAPHLASGFQIRTATEEQTRQLACNAGVEHAEVADWVQAHVLAEETQISADLHFALLREGLPAKRRDLLRTPPAALREAIEGALANNRISAMTDITVESALTELRRAAVDMAFERPQDSTGCLGELVRTVLPIDPNAPPGTPEAARVFFDKYLAHEATAPEFWTALPNLMSLPGAGAVADLQIALQLGALARLHLPLVKRLQARRQSGTITGLRDLAKLSTQDWQSMLDELEGGAPVGVPRDVPGDDDTAKKATYAKYLRETVRRAFPTAMLAADILREAPTDEVGLFLDGNPSFEMGKKRVEHYLAEQAGTVVESARQGLKRVERLFKLSPRHEDIKVLWDGGVHSARDIVRMGERAFLADFTPQLEVGMAEEIWANAGRVAAQAAAIYAKYAPATNPKGPYALADASTPTAVANQAPAAADWATLFGDADFCDCEHCNSVYGPAAYIVDLLQFLGGATANANDDATAKDALLLKRPDLAYIDLTCANTLTPLPYVDLVNEILEHAVSALSFTNHIATTGTAEDLRAMPAVDKAPNHAFDTAYTTLLQAVYPWSLPFDLAGTEARVYLDHLGVPRHELMRVLGGDAVSAIDLATEELGLSYAERVTITTPAGTVKALWGLAETDSLDSLKEHVTTFLEKSGLSYDELVDLLDTAYVSRLGGPYLTATPPDACSLDKMAIGFTGYAGVAEWDAIQRFVRLARHAGFSFRELDQASAALGTTIDDDFILELAKVHGLRARFDLPVAVVASWFGVLENRRRDGGKVPSFYDLIYQNRAVQSPPDAGLNHTSFQGTLGDHASALQGSLGISAAELALLTDPATALAETGATSPFLSTAPVSLASLSGLHRYVSFSRALGLSLRDFLILEHLAGSGANPFTTSTVDGFLRVVDDVRRSGLAAANLLYLFTDIAPSGTTIAPAGRAIADVLDKLLADLVKLRDDAEGVTDPDGIKLKALLAELVSAQATRDAILAQVEATPPAPNATLNPALVPLCWDAGALSDKLLGPSALDTVGERYAATLASLTLERDGEKLIQQRLGAALGVEPASMALLLNRVLTQDDAALIDALKFLPGSPPPYAAEAAAYRHLAKAVTLVKGLGISSLELERFFAPAEGFTPLFDLDAFPRGAAAPDSAVFQAWCVAVRVTGMRAALPVDGLEGLFTLLLGTPASPDWDSLSAAISGASGWSAGDVKALSTGPLAPQSAGLTNHAPHVARYLLALRDACASVRSLGVTAPKAIEWTAPSVSLSTSAAIIKAAKAKHTGAEWAEVAPPLRDGIRAKQRDVLADYLVVQKGYADRDTLFGELYIDVEVAPCQLTSRIKQAIGSVQSFVQRALLHLEPGVKLTEEAARQWSWRKSYRVWEANRKIFLYPENWVYPELRDEKSHLFRAFERDLRQKEISDEVAEEAVARYLEGLDEIAHLDIVAMFHEKEAGDSEHDPIDRLHVIGRTQLEPHKYFHRVRIDRARWTPWEPLDVDIEGNHLVLAVFNRRPHLFWPIIEQRPAPDPEQPAPTEHDAGPPPKQRMEIRLAWSELRGGKWSARRVSTGDLITLTPVVAPEWLTFALEKRPGGEYAVSCLVDIRAWRKIGMPQFLRLGIFSIDVCSRLVRAVSYKRDLGSWRVTYNVEQTPPDDLPEVVIDYVGQVDDPPSKAGDRVKLLYAAESRTFFQDSARKDKSRLVQLPLVIDDSASFKTVLKHVLGADKDVGKSRVLFPHWISSMGTTAKDAYSEAPILFVKDPGGSFFGELLTVDDVTWVEPSASHPGMGIGLIGTEIHGWTPAPLPEMQVGYPEAGKGYRFWTFYHPYACSFLKAIQVGGVAGLLRWPVAPGKKSIQYQEEASFEQRQPVDTYVFQPYPMGNVDFSSDGAFSSYNWEVFFHVPFLVATRLMQNQRFEEAQKWLHYIFDPTAGGTAKAPQRFWRVRPFVENKDLSTIQEEIALLAQDSEAQVSEAAKDLNDTLSQSPSARVNRIRAEIEAWEKDPFNPHAIARIRPLAYQKAVVMKYIENLIAWADQLFRRDTIESINEATQLYILASQVLGRRPQRVRPTVAPEVKSYHDIDGLGMGAFSDPLVEAEALVPKSLARLGALAGAGRDYAPPPDIDTLLFCVPPDEMLLALWDTVADRLFKLRHCMNIEGVVRELPLFEPPIDPALLVRAGAAGVDIGSVLDDVSPVLPHYRFSVMHAKAMELASSVTSLGGALLSAMEKRDAEELSRLRSGHEIDMLAAVREVREQQVLEVRRSLDGLNKSLEMAQTKLEYYATLPRVSAGEATALATGQVAMTVGVVAQALASGASTAHAAPTVTFGAAGWAGSPVTISMAGGEPTGNALSSEAHALTIYSGMLRDQAATLGTMASYDRRWEEWKLQERLAKKEIEQLQKQIVAAEIRAAIAEKELQNHDLQREHAREVADHLRTKLTNADLYEWMIEEIGKVYRDAYDLAYDTAKRAEKAFRFERAVESSGYITYGYWDGLKHGLLAGEKLVHDLRRLERAYLDQNAREYEITKHVSLAALDPAKLMTLRQTGSCTFDVTEDQFDVDFPGHYLRRLKSVSLTLPAVGGPYTGVNCTLRLKSNSVRAKPLQSSGVLRTDLTPVSASMVTSSAQNDAGVFELNFRDERYLPFEGAGAVSEWEVELPKASNGFDIGAVSDAILHLRYTARDGGAPFRDAVRAAPAANPREGKRLISARTEFADAWEKFINQPAHELVLPLTQGLFSYVSGNQAVTFTDVELYARWSVSPAPLANASVMTPTSPRSVSLTAGQNGFASGTILATGAALGDWRITLGTNPIDSLQDIWLLVEYTQPVVQ